MDGASDVTAFILAGGKSARMGTDKAFVALEGRTLLARALELGRSVSPEVRIVGPKDKFSAFAPVVEDVFAGCGPLGGIHAALRAAETEWNIILAVDMPFASLTLLQYLIRQARHSPSALATVTRLRDGWQPLCAVYRRGFADLAERALREGRCKIDELFEAGHTQVISQEDLEVAGFSPRIFRNLNTPEDLAEASG
jgi:molybdopterin-guanine dinucleotide biosynthesis protein A